MPTLRSLTVAVLLSLSVAFLGVSAFDLKYYSGDTCSGDSFASLVWNTAGCTNVLGQAVLQTSCQAMIACLSGKTTGEDYVQCALGGPGSNTLTYKVEQLNSVSGVRLFVFNQSSLCAANTAPVLTFDVLETTCSAVSIGSQACFVSPASDLTSAMEMLL